MFCRCGHQYQPALESCGLASQDLPTNNCLEGKCAIPTTINGITSGVINPDKKRNLETNIACGYSDLIATYRGSKQAAVSRKWQSHLYIRSMFPLVKQLLEVSKHSVPVVSRSKKIGRQGPVTGFARNCLTASVNWTDLGSADVTGARDREDDSAWSDWTWPADKPFSCGSLVDTLPARCEAPVLALLVVRVTD